MSLLHPPRSDPRPHDDLPDDQRTLKALVGELRRQVYQLQDRLDAAEAEVRRLRANAMRRRWWRP